MSSRAWEILTAIEVILFIAVIIGNIILYFQAMEWAHRCYRSYTLLRERCSRVLCDEEDYSLMNDLLNEFLFHRWFARKRIVNILITTSIFSPAIGYTANNDAILMKFDYSTMTKVPQFPYSMIGGHPHITLEPWIHVHGRDVRD